MADRYLDTIAFVLVQPQDLVNVAAVVRLMSNFGLRDLRLVEPAAFDPHRILGIAHGTEGLVGAIRRFESLSEALRDCGLVMGTSGRPRAADRVVMGPRAGAERLLASGEGPASTAAVLFGPEQDGLANEALDLCHAMIRIPTHPDNRSLNLAQAALLIAYELFVQRGAGRGHAPADLATGAERESMFTDLEQMLGALYPASPQVRMAGALSRLRTLLMRAAPTAAETAALANLWRHVHRRLAGASVGGDEEEGGGHDRIGPEE